MPPTRGRAGGAGLRPGPEELATSRLPTRPPGGSTRARTSRSKRARRGSLRATLPMTTTSERRAAVGSTAPHVRPTGGWKQGPSLTGVHELNQRKNYHAWRRTSPGARCAAARSLCLLERLRETYPLARVRVARGEVSCVYEIMSCGTNYVYFERVCVGALFIFGICGVCAAFLQFWGE